MEGPATNETEDNSWPPKMEPHMALMGNAELLIRRDPVNSADTSSGGSGSGGNATGSDGAGAAAGDAGQSVIPGLGPKANKRGGPSAFMWIPAEHCPMGCSGQGLCRAKVAGVLHIPSDVATEGAPAARRALAGMQGSGSSRVSFGSSGSGSGSHGRGLAAVGGSFLPKGLHLHPKSEPKCNCIPGFIEVGCKTRLAKPTRSACLNNCSKRGRCTSGCALRVGACRHANMPRCSGPL